jgi:predicted ATPase
MLTRLKLTNFRGFSDHDLEFQKFTLIVGRNNAGKSTVIDARRLVALCTARYRTLTYVDAPRELRLRGDFRGIVPSMREIVFDTQNIFHRYGRPPATIMATFSTGSTLTIYVNDEASLFAILRNSDGYVIASRPQAQNVPLTTLHILPQVAPIAAAEKRLTPEYIRRAASSFLASSHFRNQLLVYRDRFDAFKELAERNWHRLQIGDFITDGGELRNDLHLFIRDDDFVAEVARMGHGLQIWLQTMWFIARIDEHGAVILDEPDVYLHADLQRRLIRLLKQQDRQSIIATHSVEMISEVTPDSVLVIDRKRRASSFASSLPAVQKVVDSIGGIHNLHLARLWNSRKILLIEGKDIEYLKRFQDILFSRSSEPIDAIPRMTIGGWGGWNYAIGSTMLLYNAGGDAITPYCIFDSDYHLEEDVAARYSEAEVKAVQLHVWKRKEIENYLISAAAIHRLLKMRLGDTAPAVADIERIIGQFCEDMKDEVFENYVEEYVRRKRPKSTAEAVRYARTRIDRCWDSLSGKIGVVSGKNLLSRLSGWGQNSFGISMGVSSILRILERSDLANELVAVMDAIENNAHFPPP